MFALFKKYIDKINNIPQEEFRFWMLFFVSSGFFLSTMMIPCDDYWRHLAASVKDLSYKSFYFDTRVPNFNQYIGYDILLSQLYKIFGEYSYVPIQIISLSLYTAGFYLATKNIPPNIRSVFYTILILTIFSRITLARPVILESAVFFFLWFYESKKIRLLLSTLLAPLYWLFFIYLIPLILKEKMVIIPLMLGFLFWDIYSNGEYIQEVVNIFEISSNRTIAIGEGIGIYISILHPAILSILPVIMLAKDENVKLKEIIKLDIKTAIASMFFFISGQIRYFVDSIAPLMISYGRFIKRDVPEYVSAFCLFIILIFTPKQTENFKDISKLREILKDKNVLFLTFSHINFETTYRLMNDNIRVTPAMEFEWADKEVKMLIKQANENHTIDCNLLKKTNAQIVIENSLIGNNFNCMEYIASYKNYRIWIIKKEVEVD